MSFGPFEIGHRLGSGGQADVFRAVHAPTGTPVAVKVTRDDASGRFPHELATLADLDHPHVVRLWGAGVEGGAPWFAMELAEGTLADRALDWPAVREVLAALLSALAHVHARGLLHLDLKPANVLVGCVDGSDELPGLVPGVRLSDFGLAWRHGGSARRMGTLGFSAPEQLRREVHRLGPETDLYALGQLAWCLLTGQTAHGASGSAEDQVRAQLRGTLPRFAPLVPTPDALSDWLGWLLDPDPYRRPQRAVEALDALPPAGPEGAGSGGLVPRPPSDSAPTFVLEEWTGTGLPEHPGPVGRPRPPWRSWWRPERWGRVRWLLDGGLGPVSARHPRFVGRRVERDRLWALLHEVREEGSFRGVVLRGAPGAGTSRLASWLAERVHELDLGVTVAVRHTPAGGPGEGLIAACRALLGAVDLRGAALVTHARGLARAMGLGAEWAERLVNVLEGEGDVTGLAEAPGWRDRPLVLVVDDARFGPGTVDQLRPLVGRAVPVLLVLVAADGEGPASAAISALGLPELRLGPLSLDEFDHLEQWIGAAPELGDALLVATGGAPGPVLDLVRALDAAGRIRSSPLGFRIDGPLPALSAPPGLHALDGDARRRLAEVVIHGGGEPVAAWVAAGLTTPDGRVEDPRLWPLAAEDPEAWARAAERAPTATRAARCWFRAGEPERAAAGVEAFVWGYHPPDLDAVALTVEVPATTPALRLLSLVLADRRGRRRGTATRALALADDLAPGSRERALALETAAWLGLDQLTRAVCSRLLAEAEEGYAATGEARARTRARYRRMRFAPAAERRAWLRSLLDTPDQPRALLQLCDDEPERWLDALLDALRDGSITVPFAAEGHRVAADALGRAGRFDEARVHLRAARESPRWAEHSFRVVVTLTEADLDFRAERWEAALASCLSAAEMLDWMQMDPVEAHVSAAAALLALGRTRDARARLPRAHPSHHPVTAAGLRIVRFAVELAAGAIPDPDAAWAAVWDDPTRLLAENGSVHMYEALVRRAAAGTGWSPAWPTAPDAAPPAG